MFKTISKYRMLLLSAALILMLGAGCLYFEKDLVAFISYLKSDQIHPAVLIFSFLILPLMFFPVTALLVLIGVRFDMAAGLLIMFMLMPIHLAVSFYVVRSIFRTRMERYAKKKNYRILNIPKDRYIEFGFLFMAVPGLPYSVKNYLLPASGIPFREYFLISWLVNGVLGIPFIVLGDAASQWSVPLLIIFVLLFFIAYVIARKIRKRYHRLVQSTTDH